MHACQIAHSTCDNNVFAHVQSCTIFHQERMRERSTGTEREQIIERFGIVSFGMVGGYRVQHDLVF